MSDFKEKAKILDISDYFEPAREIKPKARDIELRNIFRSWIGSFIGIMILSVAHNLLHLLSNGDFSLMIGSFGATAVLAYGASDSPLSQPRNIIGGHMLSALVGVLVFKLFGTSLWFASALSVSSAIALMQVTKTLHPPGGATALIAVIGGENIHKLGFFYPFVPVAVGAGVMVLIAVFINNIGGKKYPI